MGAFVSTTRTDLSVSPLNPKVYLTPLTYSWETGSMIFSNAAIADQYFKTVFPANQGHETSSRTIQPLANGNKPLTFNLFHRVPP